MAKERFYSLRLHSAQITLGAASMTFEVPAGGCWVWPDAAPDGWIRLSLLSGRSGSGKTTLLRALYTRIRYGRDTTDGLLDFGPDLKAEDASVAYIPQLSPEVSHWKVSELVSRENSFLHGVFGKEVLRRRLGELSGGQQRKVYLCSALELLASARATSRFLLLDETLDGLGADEAVRTIQHLRQVWQAQGQAPLHVVLVTHLNRNEVTSGVNVAMHVHLEVLDAESLNAIRVTVDNRG